VWRAGLKLVAHGHHIARERITSRYRKVLEKILR
jgi:hypothetical protein